MVNIIGGSALSSALAAEKSIEPKKNEMQTLDQSADPSITASLASYLSLPGYNPTVTDVQATSDNNDTGHSKAADMVKSVAESDDEALKTALKQFDEGLKKLINRPEAQAFQAKFSFGIDDAASPNMPMPDPLPGVTENGQLESSVGKDDMAADTNKDGKVSEDERNRYEMPLTYRATRHHADELADGPSAFAMAEVNRAYGVVATAEAA